MSFSAFAKQFARYRAPAFGQAVLLETALRWGVVAPGYGCFYHRTRGAKACENGLTAPMDEINVTVLEGFRRDVFTPDLRTGTIEDLIREWQTQAVDAIPRREDLKRELRVLEAEIAGLEEQLATGAPWPLIQDPPEARRRRRESLVVPVGLLERQPIQRRQILRKLFPERLVFDPFDDDRGVDYEIRGQASYGRLLAGVCSVVPPG